jgi:hypothetical protein
MLQAGRSRHRVPIRSTRDNQWSGGDRNRSPHKSKALALRQTYSVYWREIGNWKKYSSCCVILTRASGTERWIFSLRAAVKGNSVMILMNSKWLGNIVNPTKCPMLPVVYSVHSASWCITMNVTFPSYLSLSVVKCQTRAADMFSPWTARLISVGRHQPPVPCFRWMLRPVYDWQLNPDEFNILKSVLLHRNTERRFDKQKVHGLF